MKRGQLTPLGIMIATIATVFVAEVVAMFVVGLFEPHSHMVEVLSDAALLSVLIAPVLILVIFRPMSRQLIQRSSANQELRRANDRLEYLLHSCPATIYTSRASGDFGATFISDTIKGQTGFEPRDFTANSQFWVDNIHPDDRERVFAELGTLFEHGSHVHEYRFRYADGTYGWMRDELRLMRDEAGEPIEIVGSWIDITKRRQVEEEMQRLNAELEARVAERTADLLHSNQRLQAELAERKRAEETLRESEARTRLIIDTALDAVVTMDSSGTVTGWNPSAEATFGRTEEQTLGREMAEMVIPDRYRQAHRDGLRSFLETGEGPVLGTRIEIVALHSDGHEFPIELAISPLQVGGQHIFSGFVRDLSERKRAEETLRRSEASYRGLVDHATYGIYRSAPDGRFLMANPAMALMLGCESETELLTASVADLCGDPERRERLLEHYRDAASIDELEVEWQCKGGKPVTLRLNGRPIRNETGELECYEMIAQDVTEQHKLERQLQQAQKMEAVGQLTGGIAHDFNNILTIIVSNAALVAEALPKELEEAQTELEELQAAAQRGAEMIKKLLGFSRRERLAPQSVNLAQLVAETKIMLARLLPEHIEVRVDADESVGSVRADSGAVEQILLNLATNARDAMPEGGTLTFEVRADRLEAGYHATHPWVVPGEYVRIAVSDTGVGMDEVTKQKIFEPFYTTKKVGEGTGLGMAMIYGLVKQHGGFVHVYSELGKGTEVKLYFPVVHSEAEATVPAPAREASLPVGTETILLVEDEAAIRRAAKRALEAHGYSVLVAADGEEALEVFGAHESEVDLIMSDLVMPKLGGRQLYDALRQRGNEIKFLFSSGYSADELREGTALEPGTGFVQKPWTLSDLLGGIRGMLDHGTSS